MLTIGMLIGALVDLNFSNCTCTHCNKIIDGRISLIEKITSEDVVFLRCSNCAGMFTVNLKSIMRKYATNEE